jgi:hypothetical protein
MTTRNSVIHFLKNQFRPTNDMRILLLDLAKPVVESIHSDTLRISSRPSAILLNQLHNIKIDFDFLTNRQLMSSLTTIVFTIEKSYETANLLELFNIFFQLIASPSVHGGWSSSLDFIFINHFCALKRYFKNFVCMIT